MAGLNEWTNGCMSVVEMSYFSYHVAAGSTMSEYVQVLVIRKSMATARSSLPSGASSRHRTSTGRSRSGVSSARTALCAPSRWRMKYSMPLPDEPNRFARHTVSTRGKFTGLSGSSPAKCSRSLCNSSTT
jgi:hypothetical protein